MIRMNELEEGMTLARDDMPYPSGAVRVMRDGEMWHFSPMGGGLVYQLDDDLLGKLHKLSDADTAEWQESGFGFEDDDGFWPQRGYHQGFHWNGWAKPAFDREVAERIMGHMGAEWRMDDESKALVFTVPGDEEEHEWPSCSILVDVPGAGKQLLQVYDAGGDGWTWDEEETRGKVTRLLRDIKAMWDEHGFGDDDRVSEPLKHRLEAAIKEVEEMPW
jgi:hypothetical protein